MEIDVQKDQGLRRESRRRERREKENRAAEEDGGGRGCGEGRKGEAYHVSRNELPAPQGVQLLHVHPSPLPCSSSPRLVSSPPPCPPCKHPRTFFHRSRFVFLVEREGYPTRLRVGGRASSASTHRSSCTLAKRFVEFEQDLNVFFVRFIEYDSRLRRLDSLSVSFRVCTEQTWKENKPFIIRIFFSKRYVALFVKD